MSNVSSRPPLSEGAASAIASDIKSGERKGQTSEVPLAFRAGQQSADPVASNSTVMNRISPKRRKLAVYALTAAAVLFIVWALA